MITKNPAKTALTLLLFLGIFSGYLSAAAPNDINTNQRAWFDAVDVNANNNYTDNPANNTAISVWNDKSGANNDISSSGSNNPTYFTNNPSSQRNALKFDGNDFLDSPDIWTGNVSNSEFFAMATTDVRTNGFLFASMVNNTRRISTHIPWGSGITFWDHGDCCSAPARLNGTLPISYTTPYHWHFIGNSNLQAVVRDGETLLSDSGVGTYIPTNSANFGMGYNVAQNNNFHNGRVFEFIAFQRGLNSAERRIMSSYLSAKWDKSFSTSPTYADVYNGDDSANGDYDFFVGGIGQENGTNSVGTSQGLTITDNNFLNSNGKYVLAGVDYLTTTPITGTVSADLPVSYINRSNRSWYIDTSGTGGTVSLNFNAASIGIPVANGDQYGLLYRAGISGVFTEVATATMNSGNINFSHLPADGIYVIGKRLSPLTLKKTSCVIFDPQNLTSNPKRIPGSTIRYALEVSNTNSVVVSDAIVEDSLNAIVDSSTVENLQIQAAPCDCSGIAAANNNGVNGTANGIVPVKLDFGTIPAGSISSPTVRCGYFEVKIN